MMMMITITRNLRVFYWKSAYLIGFLTVFYSLEIVYSLFLGQDGGKKCTYNY